MSEEGTNQPSQTCFHFLSLFWALESDKFCFVECASFFLFGGNDEIYLQCFGSLLLVQVIFCCFNQLQAQGVELFTSID